jgi:hypothetical protein
MYRIYVLNPDHRLITRLGSLDQAKGLAKDLVAKGYHRAEVWDAIIPIWQVWQERGGGIRTSDDREVLHA